MHFTYKSQYYIFYSLFLYLTFFGPAWNLLQWMHVGLLFVHFDNDTICIRLSIRTTILPASFIVHRTHLSRSQFSSLTFLIPEWPKFNYACVYDHVNGLIEWMCWCSGLWRKSSLYAQRARRTNFCSLTEHSVNVNWPNENDSFDLHSTGHHRFIYMQIVCTDVETYICTYAVHRSIVVVMGK